MRELYIVGSRIIGSLMHRELAQPIFEAFV